MSLVKYVNHPLRTNRRQGKAGKLEIKAKFIELRAKEYSYSKLYAIASIGKY